MLQWYFQISQLVIIVSLVSFSIAFLLFFLLPQSLRFKLQALHGIVIQLLLICLGLWLTWQNNIRNNADWYGNYYAKGSYLFVRINEPLTEKAKSFKADGYVESVFVNGKNIRAKGKVLLYFSKDSIAPALHYGDRVMIHKNLQPIKNSGNPGAFNYERYAAFQGIFHNVFLKHDDWHKVNGPAPNNKTGFWQFIYSARDYVLSVLRKSIHTGKDQLNIAEALLIGYTNDLDKDLVQAYSNTGVVHIIAISGMHLGLIYVMLIWLFAKMPVIKKSKAAQVFMILCCLWLFALLTGASASVLRAAVMFSFISLGKLFFKQTSIYNSLAASAFALLCYNPYYLWAVGFQLSYLAVLGIIIFQKTIHNLLYVKNKWLNKIWALISVSTAAQLLTFPVCIYYFHQFPNLFLISNIIAVPLAMIILYAAIALAAFSWIPFVSLYLGKLVGGLTWFMNKVILWINDLPFSVWDKIPATVISTCLMYAVIAGLSAWLMKIGKNYLVFSLIALLAFVMLSTYNKWQVSKQQKLIVYNVPGHQAIDFVSGSKYQFTGDSILLEDGMLQNFHLKPGRIAFQLNSRVDSLNNLYKKSIFYQFGNKKIVTVFYPVNTDSIVHKTDVDVIIISKNPKLNIASLAKIFNCKLFVFDASNPVWKIEKWIQECRAFNLNCYSVPAQGAFVYNIGI